MLAHIPKKYLIVASTIFGVSLIGTALLIQNGFFTTKKPTNNSWIKGLSFIPGETSVKTLTEEDVESSGIFVPISTTTTGIIAQEAFLNTAMHQASADGDIVDDTSAQNIADAIIAKSADKNPVKMYSRGDLRIVSTNQETFNAYKTDLSQALLVFSQENKLNELEVATRAIQSKDQKSLDALKAGIPSYKTLIKKLLEMNTPDIMSDVQLFLVQGYALALSGVEDMSYGLSDPARGIVGVGKYNQGFEFITIASEALKK